MSTVATALRQKYNELRIIVVPDAGGEQQAEAIARGLGGPAAWVPMPDDAPANFDANDMAAERGIDGLADWLLGNEKTPPQRFNLMTPSDLAALPPARWRIRGVLPESGIAAIYGPPASGKSFLALDMLAAVAGGRDWFDSRAKAAPVLYVALEGEAGIAQRVKAHAAQYGQPDGMRFLAAPLDLRKPQDRADIVAAARSAGMVGGVVCIDTLAASVPGMDENSSADIIPLWRMAFKHYAFSGVIGCLGFKLFRDTRIYFVCISGVINLKSIIERC